jgi:hypothetical protein
MVTSEPRSWAERRQQEQETLFPELRLASPDMVSRVDGYRVQQGRAPSAMTMQTTALAAAIARARAGQRDPNGGAFLSSVADGGEDNAPNVLPWLPSAAPDPYSREALSSVPMPPDQSYYGASASLGETAGRAYRGITATAFPDANSVVQELGRPINYLPVGAGSLPLRIARGVAGGLGARFAGEAAYRGLEGAPEPLRAAGAIGAGLLGGGVGIAAAGRLPAAGRYARDVGRALKESPPLRAGEATATANLIPGVGPDAIQSRAIPVPAEERTYLKRLFNVDVPEAGLTAGDKFTGAVRAMFGGVREDAIATPIMKMIESSKPRIQNQAARMGSVVEAVANAAFKRDELGRIASLPGNPTLQTVAARLPEFDPYLTPHQRSAIEAIQNEIADYRPLVDEAGIEIGSRRDIVEGGFYLPRGKVVSVRGRSTQAPGGRAGGGSAGYRKEAVFDSMEQGIDAGYRYEPLASAVSRHVEQTGGDAVRKYAETLFKEATGEGGELIGRSQHQRLLDASPGLAAKVEGVRKSLASLRGTAARIDDRFHAIVGRATNRPAPQERIVLTSSIIDSDRLPAMADLTSAIAAKRAALTRDGAGAIRRNAANTKAIAELGELEALADVRGAIDQAGGDVTAALDAIDKMNTDLGRAAQARSNTSTRMGLLNESNAARNRRVRAGQSDRLTRATRVEGGGDDMGILASHSNTLNQIVESMGLDVRVQRALDSADSGDLDALASALRNLRVGANAVGKRGVNYGKNRAELLTVIDEATRTLKAAMPEWTSAKERAAQTPLFAGQIDLPGLRGTSFPAEVAAAANRRLDLQKPPTGRGTAAVRAMQAVNALLRMTGSALDISGTALQGLLGVALDPRAYGAALKTSVRGWWDPDSLGAYFHDFDQRAQQAGKPTSKDWAAVGQRIGSNLTEYTGEGLPDAIRRAYEGSIPGTGRLVKGGLNPARGANRQFGFFGDVLRNELSDTAYDIAQGAGKLGGDSRAVMADIAQGSNRMTGWSTRRFGGDLGELALFAPRYFQANIETLVDAVKGLRPGASMSQAQARNALLRLIGVGTALTVAVNEARGKDTDFRLLINGRRNPNFVRMLDVGGQDISVFGIYDRLVGLVALAATGEYSRAARSFINAPIVARAWDIIEGKDAIGQPVRDDPQQFAGYLLRSVAPYAGQSYAEGAQQLAARDVGAGAATIGVGATGLRGSPQSLGERVAAGEYGDLSAPDQLKAHRAQSWQDVGKAFGTATLGGATSYGAWRQQQVDALAGSLRKAGLSEAQAMENAETAIDKQPVSKMYEQVRNGREDAWAVQHPHDAAALLDKESRLPASERTFRPTAKVRAYIEAMRRTKPQEPGVLDKLKGMVPGMEEGGYLKDGVVTPLTGQQWRVVRRVTREPVRDERGVIVRSVDSAEEPVRKRRVVKQTEHHQDGPLRGKIARVVETVEESD